jgi:hypothetical protein
MVKFIVEYLSVWNIFSSLKYLIMIACFVWRSKKIVLEQQSCKNINALISVRAYHCKIIPAWFVQGSTARLCVRAALFMCGYLRGIMPAWLSARDYAYAIVCAELCLHVYPCAIVCAGLCLHVYRAAYLIVEVR